MSTYCCNFNVNNSEIRGADCFGGYYDQMHSYKNIKVFILKNYPYPYEQSSDMSYTTEAVIKYVDYFKKMGFTLDFSEEKIKLNSKTCDAYAVSWKIGNQDGENTVLSTLILMNALRYLYENPYQKIVDAFFHLASQEGDVHLFNRFLIAHVVAHNFPSGHMLHKPHFLEILLNDDEIETLIKKDNTPYSWVQGNLKVTKHLNETPIAELINNNKSLNEIYTKYKELCEKYM